MSVAKSRYGRVLLVTLTTASTVAATAGVANASPVGKSQSTDLRRPPVSMAKLSPAPMPTIGQPAPEGSPDAPVAINSLHRSSTNLVSLTWSMKYNGDSDFTLPTNLVSVYKYAGSGSSAITLTDEAAKIRYNPLRADPSQKCICTNTSSIPNDLNKGESATFYEVFMLPSTTRSVTVSIPGYSPAKNIPVS